MTKPWARLLRCSRDITYYIHYNTHCKFADFSLKAVNVHTDLVCFERLNAVDVSARSCSVSHDACEFCTFNLYVMMLYQRRFVDRTLRVWKYHLRADYTFVVFFFYYYYYLFVSFMSVGLFLRIKIICVLNEIYTYRQFNYIKLVVKGKTARPYYNAVTGFSGSTKTSEHIVQRNF